MKNIFASTSKQTFTASPNKSAGILDDFAVRKNVATREGTVEKVPVNNSDITNKAYINTKAAAVHTHLLAAGATDITHTQAQVDARAAESGQSRMDTLRLRNPNATPQMLEDAYQKGVTEA